MTSRSQSTNKLRMQNDKRCYIHYKEDFLCMVEQIVQMYFLYHNTRRIVVLYKNSSVNLQNTQLALNNISFLSSRWWNKRYKLIMSELNYELNLN